MDSAAQLRNIAIALVMMSALITVMGLLRSEIVCTPDARLTVASQHCQRDDKLDQANGLSADLSRTLMRCFPRAEHSRFIKRSEEPLIRGNFSMDL